MCEILAPCGDKNTAFIAINSGADAIYLGMSDFSARESAVNFSFEDLRETIKYAAFFGVKVYVAMNTVVKENELRSFLSMIEKVWECGAYAVILQDIFLGKFIKDRCPQIVLHLSTQGGICNLYGAKLAKEYGFSRVILSRETILADITEISRIIETEVFVQGALCTCFSGQCYLSSFIGGNSGNRGRCKQPCRKLYSIDAKGFEDYAYRLSLSDLCIGNDIGKLISAGVTSFKIEGRMRRPEYVAAAVNFYRDIINNKDGNISALKRTYNRGNYTKGLAFGQDDTLISSSVQGHLGEFAGVIKIVGGKYFCRSSFKCSVNDCFKILRNGKELGGAVCVSVSSDGFFIAGDKVFSDGDAVYITTDTQLNQSLLSARRYKDVNISAKFVTGKLPEVSIDGVIFKGDEILLPANNRALSADDVKKCFRKVDGRPFNVIFNEITIEGKPYMGMGSINAFRRSVYDMFTGMFCDKDRKAVILNDFPEITYKNNNLKAVIASDLNGVKADIGIYKPGNYFQDNIKSMEHFDGEKYLYLPPYMTGEELEKLKAFLDPYDGVYCEGTYGIRYAQEVNKKLFAGVGFNITNSISAAYCGANYYCISKELTLKEAMPLCSENAFYLSGGGIKVMDIIYCPFSKNCKTCERRQFYTLKDENKRKFPLRRYRTDVCRFELYNCAALEPAEEVLAGNLFDYTQKSFSNGMITRGHTNSPVK